MECAAGCLRLSLEAERFKEALIGLTLNLGGNLNVGFEAGAMELLFQQGVELEEARGVVHLNTDTHRLLFARKTRDSHPAYTSHNAPGRQQIHALPPVSAARNLMGPFSLPLLQRFQLAM